MLLQELSILIIIFTYQFSDVVCLCVVFFIDCLIDHAIMTQVWLCVVVLISNHKSTPMKITLSFNSLL